MEHVPGLNALGSDMHVPRIPSFVCIIEVESVLHRLGDICLIDVILHYIFLTPTFPKTKTTWVSGARCRAAVG